MIRLLDLPFSRSILCVPNFLLNTKKSARLEVSASQCDGAWQLFDLTDRLCDGQCRTAYLIRALMFMLIMSSCHIPKFRPYNTIYWISIVHFMPSPKRVLNENRVAIRSWPPKDVMNDCFTSWTTRMKNDVMMNELSITRSAQWKCYMSQLYIYRYAIYNLHFVIHILLFYFILFYFLSKKWKTLLDGISSMP